MPRKKKAEKVVEDFKEGNYKFFAKDIESSIPGTQVVNPSELDNPDGNSTGSLNLDVDLGVPFPEGCMIEVIGDEGSFKTAIALEAIGYALMAGKHAAYINLENSGSRRTFDNIRSVKDQIALDEHKLRMFNVDGGEAALNVLKRFVEEFPKSLVVFDSIDAAVPEGSLAKDIGDKSVGDLPRLMSDACRKLAPSIRKTGSTIVFINQLREKIGVMYGDPSTSSGGRAVKFYSTQRIRMLKPGKAQTKTDADGNQIGVIARYKILKNRYGPINIDGEFPILFGNGVFRQWEIMERAVLLGVLQLGGRGGKQILLPKRVRREDGEIEYTIVDKENKFTFIAMKKIDASRRLLLDQTLSAHIEGQIFDIIDPMAFEAAEEFMEEDDEICDADGEGDVGRSAAEQVPSEERASQ
jgi:recombination protein RecA